MNQCDSSVIAQCAPDPEVLAPVEDRGEPRNPIETAVAQIWASVLGVDRVDIHENFLLLGGESLMATQVASEVLSQLEVEVPIRSILVGTVAEVAQEITAKLGKTAA